MPARHCGATDQTATDINALVAEMRAGLEGVSPGPWRVDEQKHPYKDGTNSHKEQRIVTTWEHPQLKACVDVTRLAIGIGLEGQPPIPMVRISSFDAAHIARCHPANISALLDEIERLRAERDTFLDGARPIPFDREFLGRMVREAWVRWAQTQPSPKPSWIVPYDDLSEPDKEADSQIGEAVARWVLIGDAARFSKVGKQ
jgi:hypothetical protein